MDDEINTKNLAKSHQVNKTISNWLGFIDEKGIVMGNVTYYNIDTVEGKVRFVDMDEVLERYENGDYRELEDSDFLTEDDKCPHCGSENIEFMEILQNASDIY